MDGRNFKKFSGGFTLIELLVVIAIIALLLSILLPGLRKAKQVAQSTVCLAHLRSANLGMQIYSDNNDAWLAGPNTSGYANNEGRVKLNENLSADTPVQNMDWISPTLAEELGFRDNGYQKLVDIFNTKFCCPANKKTYDYYYDGGEQSIESWLSSHNAGANELKYSSYSAILGFHVWDGADVYQNNGAVTLPKHYRPKLNNITSPGRKIYVIDGARYVKNANSNGSMIPWSSYNDFQYQDDGGNFMLYGPSVGISGDPFTNLYQVVMSGNENLRQDVNGRSEIYMQYGFRHNQGLNAIFFDGHCERLKWMESLDVKYYFTGGAEVTRAVGTADPYDSNGQIIR